MKKRKKKTKKEITTLKGFLKGRLKGFLKGRLKIPKRILPKRKRMVVKLS